MRTFACWADSLQFRTLSVLAAQLILTRAGTS